MSRNQERRNRNEENRTFDEASGGNESYPKEKLFRGIIEKPKTVWTAEQMAKMDWNSRSVPKIDQKTIASYNWNNNSDKPIIAVPGAPKRFEPWTGGDLSERFNSERKPGNKDETLDATFTAVRMLNPNFKISDYDIVSDFNSIAGLYRVCLHVVNAVLMKNKKPRIKSDEDKFKKPGGGQNDQKLRIEVQVVGSTLLFMREKNDIKVAHGIGKAFRRMCARTPPVDAMQGEKLDDGLQMGIFKLIKKTKLGDVTILLACTSDAEFAIYPPEDKWSGAGAVGHMGDVEDLTVVSGGYKGNMDDLDFVGLSSKSVYLDYLVPQRWMDSLLSGCQRHYVAYHDHGIVEKPPTMKSAIQIREMCGLGVNEYAADLWLKVLESVLKQIVDYARQNSFPDGRFAILVDPQIRQLSIHQYRTGPTATEKVQVVSENILQYLNSTLQ